MIRVVKSDVPERLKAGIARTEQDCADYNAGKRKFKFDKSIYGHKTVKDALIKAQYRKCCFCEGRFEAHAYGDVEHYRPKGAVQQGKNSPRLTPGYYWLAYSWDNLYWCCQVCNRSYKKNCLPLENPNQRARSHTDDIANERPLILNPGGQEDPCCHIKFRDEIAVGSTRAGRKTIEIVGLNRDALVEER